jgi:predicted regulator of Ras-like GTPase activity (Roadblock/LC7/MglB family)
LRIREDQQEAEKDADFATPFSAKAEEDAKRFNAAAAPGPKPIALSLATAASALEAPLAETKDAIASVDAPPISKAKGKAKKAPNLPVAPAVVRTALQEILDTDEDLDAKAVVSHVIRMTGVKGCTVLFADGLSLAGTLPPEFEAEGLCALAPSLLQRVESHLVETKLGSLQTMTLSCAQAAITFLMQGNLCLAALHGQEELAADVRTRLTRIVHELSQKYSHPVRS